MEFDLFQAVIRRLCLVLGLGVHFSHWVAVGIYCDAKAQINAAARSTVEQGAEVFGLDTAVWKCGRRRVPFYARRLFNWKNRVQRFTRSRDSND